MLLFKPEHVAPILTGRKVQTRRKWPRGPRVVVGGRHQCRTLMLVKSTTFAVVEVTGLRREELGQISDEDARREGYEDRESYFAVWGAIYADVKRQDSELVWVVDFKVVEAPCILCEGTTMARTYAGSAPCPACGESGFIPATDLMRRCALRMVHPNLVRSDCCPWQAPA